MKNNNVKKIIFSSTAAVYKKKSKKISEDDIVKPISKYGKTKLTAERLIQKEKSIDSIILRFFNVCSALKNTLIGELHKPETHLIPSSVSRAEKNLPINIFGKNYPTKDGTCVRDYIHIQDICDAIQKSILYLNSNSKVKEIINLGNNNGISNAEILKNIEMILNKKIIVNYIKGRKGDVPYLICNPSRALKLLKWKAKMSSIKQIIMDDIKWNLFLKKNKIFR
jgi:UDP-glucose 4-epimerase